MFRVFLEFDNVTNLSGAYDIAEELECYDDMLVDWAVPFQNYVTTNLLFELLQKRHRLVILIPLEYVAHKLVLHQHYPYILLIFGHYVRHRKLIARAAKGANDRRELELSLPHKLWPIRLVAHFDVQVYRHRVLVNIDGKRGAYTRVV